MTFGEEVKQTLDANETLATMVHKQFRDLLKEIKLQEIAVVNQSVFQIRLRALIGGYTIDLPYSTVVTALLSTVKSVVEITDEQVETYLKQLILNGLT